MDANRNNLASTSTSSGSQDQLPERSSRKRKFYYADPNDDYSDIGDFSDSGSNWEANSDEDSYTDDNEIININSTVKTSVQSAAITENLENESSIMHANVSDLSVGADGETSITNFPSETNTQNRENTLKEVNSSNEVVNGRYIFFYRHSFFQFFFSKIHSIIIS